MALQAVVDTRKHPSARDTFDIVQFTQDLISGKCRLRTTGYLSAHNHRQKKLLWDMYAQEVHDKMTPIITPEKAARRSGGSPSKGRALPPPPPKRSYTSQQAVANLTSTPTNQAMVSVSSGGAVVKTTTKTHQNGKVINSTGSTPELSSSASSVYSDDSHCMPKEYLVSKSTGSLLVQPEYLTQIVTDFEKSKSQPLLSVKNPQVNSLNEGVKGQLLNDSLPDCLEGHLPRPRVSSVDSFLSAESSLSKSTPCSPRLSGDESGDRPPKPPRGCVDAPGALRGRESPSAFTPVKSGWEETCLDNVPIRKQRHSSMGSDRSEGRGKRHAIMFPNSHHEQNGYSPIKAEMTARLQKSGVNAKTPPSHLPTSIIVTPPPPPQRQTEVRKKQSKQPPPPPQRTTSVRSTPSISPFKRQASLPVRSQNKLQQKTSPSKIPHKVSPLQINHSQQNISPKQTPTRSQSFQHKSSTNDISNQKSDPSSRRATASPSLTQEKLRVDQLKEQYAKLRELQKKHKVERDTKPAGVQETDIDEVEDEKTESQDESTPPTTKVENTDQVAQATTEVTNQH